MPATMSKDYFQRSMNSQSIESENSENGKDSEFLMSE